MERDLREWYGAIIKELAPTVEARAAQLNVCRRMVHKYENGTALPSIDTLRDAPAGPRLLRLFADRFECEQNVSPASPVSPTSDSRALSTRATTDNSAKTGQ